MSSIWAKECMLIIMCVLSYLAELPFFDGGRKSLYIIRNEEVYCRTEIERELSRTDQRVLRCLGHVERMDEDHTVRRMLMA